MSRRRRSGAEDNRRRVYSRERRRSGLNFYTVRVARAVASGGAGEAGGRAGIIIGDGRVGGRGGGRAVSIMPLSRAGRECIWVGP